jgi:hypothetical protein
VFLRKNKSISAFEGESCVTKVESFPWQSGKFEVDEEGSAPGVMTFAANKRNDA